VIPLLETNTGITRLPPCGSELDSSGQGVGSGETPLTDTLEVGRIQGENHDRVRAFLWSHLLDVLWGDVQKMVSLILTFR
jgi:hypothetical protein